MLAAPPSLCPATSEACPEHDLLADAAQGRVSPQVREAIEEHIDRCTPCRQLLSTLAAVATRSEGSSPTDRSGEAGAASLSLREPGQTVSRYVLIHAIGRGGMGVVYEAYDPELDRTVAIKLLPIADHSRRRPEQLAAALRREAAAMARLSDPHVVTVHDAGIDGHEVYIVMELMVQTLRAYELDHRDWASVLDRCIEAGSGLAAAHEAGLVHRDFKPDNVLLGRDGRARVSDFGLARLLCAPTGTTLAGTRRYMAPEQIEGDMLDARADQYAFCVSVQELLGRREGARGVPVEIHRVLRRGADARRERRYATMRALLADLHRAYRRRRAPRAVASVVAVTAIAGAVGLWFGPGLGSWRGDDDARERRTSPDPRSRPPWNGWSSAAVLVRFVTVDPGTGAQQWHRIRPVLDRYATDWSEQAAGVDLLQSPASQFVDEATESRARCLSRRRNAIGALVSTLVTADVRVVSRAVALARQLPPLARCSSEHTARRLSIVPPRADRVEAVSRLTSALDEVELWLLAGRYEEARRTLPGIVARARATEHDETIAQALLLDGDMASRDARMTRAAASYTEAARCAAAAGDPLLAARAWVGWAHRLTSIQADPAQARTALAAAEVALATAGEDPELEAMVQHAYGDVARRERRYDDALELLRASAVALVRVLGEQHPLTVSAQLDVAILEVYESQDPERRERLEALVPIVADAYGPQHPIVATALHELGVAWSRYDTDRAIALHQRALSIRRRALPPEHPEQVDSLHSLGLTTWAAGDLAAAERYAIEAVELGRRAFLDRPADQTYALLQLATIEEAKGDAEDALARLIEIATILEDDPQHPVAIATDFRLSIALEERDPSRALDLAERAATRHAEVHGEHHVDTVAYQHNLALRQWDAGQRRTALETLERARRMPEINGSGRARDLMLWTWALLLEDLGQVDDEVIATVEALGQRTSPSDPDGLAQSVERWLSRHDVPSRHRRH